MKLKFFKCNPTENMTVLVMDPVADGLIPEVAARLMSASHLHAEQVGFVSEPASSEKGIDMKLQMMGGEFCANAARSLAAIMAFKDLNGSKSEMGGTVYQLKLSGVDTAVACEVLPAEKPGTFRSQLSMPLPLKIQTQTIRHLGRSICGSLVTFPGIVHFVVEGSLVDEQVSFFQAVKEQISGKHEALGIMFYDDGQSYLEPLVWVRSTDTLIWEKGCGSGTAAVGAALAARARKSLCREIRQPGGILLISAEWTSEISSLVLSGDIQIVAEGTAYL
jgi:histidine racemase